MIGPKIIKNMTSNQIHFSNNIIDYATDASLVDISRTQKNLLSVLGGI